MKRDKVKRQVGIGKRRVCRVCMVCMVCMIDGEESGQIGKAQA